MEKEKIMPKKRNTTHVVPNKGKGGWDVKKGGQKTPLSHHRKKDTAIDKARSISKQQESELYIHGKDGRIQNKDSHGGDPHPPKG
jgi:hypothetical protein